MTQSRQTVLVARQMDRLAYPSSNIHARYNGSNCCVVVVVVKSASTDTLL